jgi:hypothetical protein
MLEIACRGNLLMKNQIYTYIYICIYDFIGEKKRESIADAAILLYMVSI